MKKPKSTITQIKLDKDRKRGIMSDSKPRENASECFKRAPYAMNKEDK